jgi:motility quorum-sensing regulator/GCU-specific mRNA interferase toxin
MEKLRPHYDLETIKAQVARLGTTAFTKTAMDGGRAMGLTTSEMLAVIVGMERGDFFKSMTTLHDHKVWQDVYHVMTPVAKIAYVKVTMRDNAPVIQFKEK